jgi:hypothetical protein
MTLDELRKLQNLLEQYLREYNGVYVLERAKPFYTMIDEHVDLIESGYIESVIEKKVKFPQDFEEASHPLIPGATQYTLRHADGSRLYSVVGGGMGIHGDGKVTFEMYSDLVGDVVLSYATANEINEYLSEGPKQDLGSIADGEEESKYLQ